MSLSLGERPPAFTLPTTSGETANLEALGLGGPLVVAFWCNHCPYVRAWEDRFNAIARDYADRGVALVAINANDPEAYPADSFDRMVERAKDEGFVFPYAYDESQEVPRAYGATRTPEVFVFAAGGGLAYHGAIDDSTEPGDVDETYLRDALDALLDGGSPAVSETRPVGCTIKWRR